MVVDGCSLDERVVRDLAAIVERPLGEKLELALFFSADIVALTFHERVAVLRALDGAPRHFEEVRRRLMDCDTWCRTHAGIARAPQPRV